jgi:hypothetical protein
MSRLKFLNVRAVVNKHWMAMGRRKSHDGPNRTLGKNNIRIIVETIVVDISEDRG